jgi:hypothetical protein
MKELFTKDGNSIFTFKKGDIIIRLKPRIIATKLLNENLGITVEIESGIDNSFRSPHEFIGIENNKIYLRSVKEDFFTNKKSMYAANIEEFSENWALFIVPEGLTLEECIKIL